MRTVIQPSDLTTTMPPSSFYHDGKATSLLVLLKVRPEVTHHWDVVNSEWYRAHHDLYEGWIELEDRQ